MSAVIRSASLPPGGHFSFQDMERQAGEIVARAATEAERLMADARQLIGDAQERAKRQAEVAQREAREKGRSEGRAEGLAAAKQEARDAAMQAAGDEVRQLTQALEAALVEYERNKHGLLALAEGGVIELAVAIARRVCRTVAAASPAAVRANVRALLELVQHDNDLEVHLNPAEHELLEHAPGELLSRAADLQHVRFIADPAIERGGCVLKTRDGTVDANITTQLDRIAAEICQTPHAAAESEPPTASPLAPDEAAS